MQNSGKGTTYRIDRNNPTFLESLEALPIKARKEVKRVEEEELSINPYPRQGSKLIEPIRWKYKDIYRVRIIVGANEKYRYVYRVEGDTIYSWYVVRKGRNTYARFRRK